MRQNETERLHARINKFGAVMIVGGVLLALTTCISAVLLHGHLERIARIVAHLEERLDAAGKQQAADHHKPTLDNERKRTTSAELPSKTPNDAKPADAKSLAPHQPTNAVASNADTQPVTHRPEVAPALPKKNARDIAMEAFQERRFAECARVAAKLLEETPDDNELRIILGRAHLALDAHAESSITFEQAVAHNPESADAWRQWGLALLRMLKPADAVFRLETAAQLDADNAQIWFELGVARTNAGDSNAAVEAFDRALALDPALAEAHVGRGVVLLHAGDTDAAASAFAQAQALNADLASTIQRTKRAAMSAETTVAGRQ